MFSQGIPNLCSVLPVNHIFMKFKIVIRAALGKMEKCPPLNIYMLLRTALCLLIDPNTNSVPFSGQGIMCMSCRSLDHICCCRSFRDQSKNSGRSDEMIFCPNCGMEGHHFLYDGNICYDRDRPNSHLRYNDQLASMSGGYSRSKRFVA